MHDQSPGSRWVAPAVTTVVLFVASVLPSPLARRPAWKLVGPDKLLHFLGHAGYVLTLANAFERGSRTNEEATVLAIGVSIAHSLVTGRLQKKIPGRASEPMDFLAALIGSSLAAWGWHVINEPPKETGTLYDSSFQASRRIP